jgi:phosphoribosylformylglycinamidine synthase
MRWQDLAEAMDANVGIFAPWIGETGGAILETRQAARAIPVGELKAAHESWFPISWRRTASPE